MRNPLFVLALGAVCIPAAHADQGSFTNVGATATPAGTFTISGSSLTYTAADGSATINATFTTSSSSESCSGGGKGGHITCYNSFSGSFRGTLTANGLQQAIAGITYQSGVVGKVMSGTTAWNSAYTPFYFSDSEQILRSDDLNGTNLTTFGTGGSGVGQFYGANAIALDAAGRIYVADTYNCRVVRFDDMNGTNWTSYPANPTCGAGAGQFYDPAGIAVDGAGNIYVADTGNGRIVQIADMNGTNWTSYNQGALSLAVDAAGRIYAATGAAIVRMDNISGANLVTLTSSQPINGVTYSLSSPVAVALDAAGRIYIADLTSYQPQVVRVDDMTGANWKSVYLGSGPSPHSIAVDAGGTVYTGGYGVQLTDDMTLVVPSTSFAICPLGCYYIFGTTPIPLPTPRPSAVAVTPTAMTFTQNVGTSATQTVSISNIGGNPLNILGISASGAFSQTNNCIGPLTAGMSCTVNVTFSPSVTGTLTGSLTISDDSYNAGAAQTVVLNGTGTAPVPSLSATSLSFPSQVEGSAGAARVLTLTNTGTGPMQVSAVTATAPFSQTNTCAAAIAPAGACTISVSFAPTTVGAISGTLTIAGNAGTQTVNLSGTGAAQVTVSASTLSFGSLAVGNTSAARTITLTNKGSAAVSLAGVGVSGPFAIASNTCPASLAAAANCAVGVTFTPAATGTASGTLTFTDSALNSPQTVTLSGTGTAPVTLSATSLSFGTVAVGATSSAKSVTITNQQSSALTFSGITVGGAFAIATNTCGPTLAAGAACTVGITFTPTATGAATGTLTITDSAPGSPRTVNLSGTGGSTTTPVTLSASTLSFGTVVVGNTSTATTVTLTNRQSAPLNTLSVSIGGPFAIASNTCGTTVAAGASCAVGVTFTPPSTGASTGTLTFTDSASNSPQKVSLSGTGASPVSLSAASLNFGVVAVGATSASQTVTITNATAAAITVAGITVTGDFADTTTCASTIPSGGNCAVTVTFTPTAGGARTGSLAIPLSTGAQTVALTGTGSNGSIPGALTLSPASLVFNGYTIGDNPSQSVTVTNSSGASAGIAGVAMSGAASLTQRTTCGASLAAGATCTITVTFQPTAYGTFTGTLTLTESSGALDTVSVSGNSSVNN